MLHWAGPPFSVRRIPVQRNGCKPSRWQEGIAGACVRMNSTSDLSAARRDQNSQSFMMAGTQRPLENLPESRVLGIKSEPELVKVAVCGASNVGKTALIARVSLTLAMPPLICCRCLALVTLYQVAYINSMPYTHL